ncbi:hypothetical protein pb186bvf_020772 [Paramecium bursaria]
MNTLKILFQQRFHKRKVLFQIIFFYLSIDVLSLQNPFIHNIYSTCKQKPQYQFIKYLRTTYQQKYQIQVVRMIIVIILTVSMAQFRTSTNTCTNEKSIFKLDVRQRVQNLPPNRGLYVQQLWTSGEYNFKDVNGTPQQTNDYRELQSIKEYSMDPSLGMLTEHYQLQTNIKVDCPHMKFLGEFSFYVSADSYLMDNATRFLRKPASMNKNIYDSRYDNDNFVWAVNDQMKTIPYSIPWNYFDPIVLNDMKDII